MSTLNSTEPRFQQICGGYPNLYALDWVGRVWKWVGPWESGQWVRENQGGTIPDPVLPGNP